METPSSFELSEEQKRIISQGNKRDFNLFTSIFSSEENNDEDIFEFDLFAMNDNNTNKEQKEEDTILIERSQNDIKNKINQQFNLNKKNEEDDNEDDLLDLMDKNL